MVSFAFDYYLMVVIAAAGTLQIAAVVGDIRGLLLFSNTIVGYSFGISLVLFGYLIFFATAERNVNDTLGGLDGNVQFVLFLLGAITATLLTFVVSSVLNRRMYELDDTTDGLEALRRTTYLKAVLVRLRSIRS